MSKSNSLWSPADGAQLKQLREQAKLSRETLASKHAISLKHLVQLEEGGDSVFYSPVIKMQVGRRLLRALGSDLTTKATETVQVVAHSDVLIAEEDLLSKNERAQILKTLDEVARIQPSSNLKKSTSQASHPLYVTVTLIIGALVVAYPYLLPMVQKLVESEILKEKFSLQSAPNQVDASQITAPAPALVNKSEASPVEVSSSPESIRGATGSLDIQSCQWSKNPISIGPSDPKGSGNYVYLEALQDVTVCVRDSYNHIAIHFIKSGFSKTVYGHAPFQIFSDQLVRLKLFFQGQRLNWPNGQFQQIQVVASPLTN
ncbi:MAG: helix-turn-helix domain-containing protein [Burkholderiaceae bacterium]